MRQLEFIPFVGVGNLRFDMSRQEIRELIGNGEERPHLAGKSVQYDGYNLFFGTDDQLELVSIFPPIDLIYGNLHLFGDEEYPEIEIISLLSSQGYVVRDVGSDGYTFDELGLSFYVPFDDEIEAISAHRRKLTIFHD